MDSSSEEYISDDFQAPPKRKRIDNTDIEVLLQSLDLGVAVSEKQFRESSANVIEHANLSHQQITSLNSVSAKGVNLLMVASKFGHVEMVKFLISCGLNVNKRDDSGFTAADFAWQYKNLRCLIKLLEGDSSFPIHYDYLKLPSAVAQEIKENLFEIALRMNNFHWNIKENKLKEVKHFVARNPQYKFAYNSKNQCALSTALEFKSTEMYYFLRSRNFATGIDEHNFNVHLEALDNRTKNTIRYKNSDLAAETLKLISKSRIGFGIDDLFADKLIDYYESLNAIPEMRPIVQLVANTEATDIVFDLKGRKAAKNEPTTGSTGHSGFILINDQRDERQVVATIACEFTYYALHLIYNNRSQPFGQYDEVQKLLFASVARNYPNETENANLISKIPYWLCIHKNNPGEVEKLRCVHRELFEFFENNFLKTVEWQLGILDKKNLIREANKKFLVYSKSQQLNLLSADTVKDIDVTKSVFIKSPVPHLVLENIITRCRNDGAKEIESKHIFIEFEQMFKQENSEMLTRIVESDTEPTVFILNSKDFETPPMPVNLKKLQSEPLEKLLRYSKTIFISSHDNADFQKYFKVQLDVTFEWRDLSDVYQLKILSSKVNFQDAEIVFKTILSDEALLHETPLETILKPFSSKMQKFEENLPKAPRALIERTFHSTRVVPEKFLKSNALLDLLHIQQTVLIADSAGMGKTTSAAHLARLAKTKSPQAWVVFLDLKQRKEVLLRDDQPLQGKAEIEFLSRELMELKSEFEQNLFKSFYKKGEVIIVIEGIDEISPENEQFVLNLLSAFQKSPNQLLVTTRLHLTEKLQEHLKTNSFKLLPLIRYEQEDFLTRHWRVKSLDVNLGQKVPVLLERFEKFRAKSLSAEGFQLNVPLLISMIAEVFDGLDLEEIKDEQLQIFSIFQAFVAMKMDVWNQRDSLVAYESVLESSNLMQAHQKLALEQLFGKVRIGKLNLPAVVDEFTLKMIARVGIVRLEADGSGQFAHHTFAQYFAANFILNGVTRRSSLNFKTSMHSLFFQVITSAEFKETREFMDGKLLGANEAQFETASLEDYLEKRVNLTPEIFSLERFVEEGLNRLIAFVLKTLNLSVRVKANLVKSVLYFSTKHAESFKTIWACVESFANEEIVKELLFHKTEATNLLLAVKCIDTLKVVLEISKKNLTSDEFLKFLTDDCGGTVQPLMFCTTTTTEWSSVLWEAAKEKLCRENMKKLFKTQTRHTRDTILHIQARHPCLRLLQDLLEMCRLVLNNCELNSILRTRDANRETFTQKAACFAGIATFSVLIKFVRVYVREDSLEWLAYQGRLCNLLTVGELVPEKVMPEATGSIETFYGLYGRSAPTEFVLSTAVWSTRLFESFAAKLPEQQFKEIILTTIKGENIFHCILENEHPEDVELLWNLVVARLDRNELANLLFKEKGSPIKNIFQRAALYNSPLLLVMIKWHEWIDLKAATCTKNIWNTNTCLLHKVALYCDANVCRAFFEFVTKSFSQKERQHMFMWEDSRGMIPLQQTSQNVRPGVFEVVQDAYIEAFSPEEYQKIISTRNI